MKDAAALELARLSAAAAVDYDTVEIGPEVFHVHSIRSSERSTVLGLMRDALAKQQLISPDEVCARGFCLADRSEPFETLGEAIDFMRQLDGAKLEVMAQKIMELSGLRSKDADKGETPADAAAKN